MPLAGDICSVVLVPRRILNYRVRITVPEALGNLPRCHEPDEVLLFGRQRINCRPIHERANVDVGRIDLRRNETPADPLAGHRGEELQR